MPPYFRIYAMKLILLVMMLLAVQVNAAPYYVDQTLGNDSNDGGSAGEAWKTIGKVNTEIAAATFSAGDIIYFKYGETWTDAGLNITCSGTAGSPITFAGKSDWGSGAKPHINLTGLGATDVAIDITNADYVTAQDFRLTGRGSESADDLVNVATSGYGGGSIGDGVFSIQIVRVDLLSNGGQADGFNAGAAEVDFTDCTATNITGVNQTFTCHTTGMTRIYSGTFTNGAIFSQNTVAAESYFNDVTISGYTAEILNVGTGGAGTIQEFNNCNITVNGGASARLYMSGNTANRTSKGIFRNCTIVCTTAYQIGYIYNTLELIDCDITINLGEVFYLYSGVFNMSGCAMDFNGVDRFMRIDETAGVGCDYTITENLFVITSGTYFFYLRDSVGGATRDFTYNKVRGIDNLSDQFFFPLLDGELYPLNINNNTFYNTSSGGAMFRQKVSNVPIMKNNIFVNIADVGSAGNQTVSNNCYYNSENLGGTGSITTDPIFVDVANYDFHLKPSSPCSNAGIDLGDSVDFDNRKIRGNPEMGAYEITGNRRSRYLGGKRINRSRYN